MSRNREIGSSNNVLVETTKNMIFHDSGSGDFTIPSGTRGRIVDTAETHKYANRYKAKDLVPVELKGKIRYVPRHALRLVGK